MQQILRAKRAVFNAMVVYTIALRRVHSASPTYSGDLDNVKTHAKLCGVEIPFLAPLQGVRDRASCELLFMVWQLATSLHIFT